MTDLRTRIAAIISSKEVVLDGWDCINQECAWLLADAVIAELGGEKALQYLQVPQRVLMGRMGDLSAEGNRWVTIEMESDDE